MKELNICSLVLCLITTFFSPMLHAKVQSRKVDSFFPTHVFPTQVKFESNAKINLTMTAYYNHNGVGEVKIESAAIPKFSKHSNPTLGFGRDIDGNGRIDTWYLITSTGIELIKKEGKSIYGTDVLNEVLTKTYKNGVAMNVASAAISILGHLFFTVSESLEMTDKYYREWMDLEELRIGLLQGMESESLTQNEINLMYEVLDYGYSDLKKSHDAFTNQSVFGYLIADVVLWGTGGVLFSFGAKVLTKIGMVASERVFIQSMRESVTGFFKNQSSKLTSKLEHIKSKFPKKPIVKKEATGSLVTSALINSTNYKKALTSSIISHRTKKSLGLYLSKAFKWPRLIVEGAKSEWKYIMLNTSVQLGSEAYARYDELKGANAYETAQNFFTNPDVIQNVSFMASETILMTGISKNLSTTKARFAASGAVALTNSSLVNFVILDDPNISRVGFDFTWEAIVGNAQVQADLMALEYFEKLAQKKNNPKLKLVGYVVTLIDMGVGYYVYAKATDIVEKNHKAKDGAAVDEPQVILVPVLALQD